MSIFRQFTIVIILVVCPTLHAFGTTYSIDFVPKYRVQETYQQTTTVQAETQSTVTKNGVAIQESDNVITITSQADITVLETDPSGSPSIMQVRIERLHMDAGEGDGKQEVFPQGTFITVSHDKEFGPQFSINGKNIEQPEHGILITLFSVKDPSLPDENTAFGPGRPVNVGETWNVNIPAVRKMLEKNFEMPFEESDIHGQFTLLEIVDFHGIECYHYQGQIMVDNFNVPLHEMERVRSTVEFFFSGMVPVHGNGQKSYEYHEMIIEIVGSIHATQENSVESTIWQKTIREIYYEHF